MPLWLDQLVLAAVDGAYACGRYPVPPRARLERARVISHRGERDERVVRENTFAAFDPLRGSGVFGIEFDVRWTRDLVPVVFHDTHLLRLFAEHDRVDALDRATLRRRHPEIPDLDETVRRYVDEFHLMVEIKHERYPDPALQNARLAAALAPALARDRCHVLSLVPAMFDDLPAVPARATMGIARLNVAEISAEALAAGRGGFCCHYATLTAPRVAAHQAAGQVVGCGFPASRSVVLREIGRGVDYLFTNVARQAEQWRRAALASAPAPENPVPRG